MKLCFIIWTEAYWFFETLKKAYYNTNALNVQSVSKIPANMNKI